MVPVPTVFGPSGAATVRISKTTVSVVYTESGEQYMFPAETVDLPKYVSSSGKWFVSVSADGTKLYAIRPLDGKFVLDFTSFKSGQDGVPSPIPVKRDPPEVKYAQHFMKFTANLVVAEGQYKGAVYPYSMRYLNLLNNSGFGSLNGNVVVQGNPTKSDHVAKLAQFLELFGGGELDVAYSANILPELQSALLRLGNTVIGTVENGWLNSLERNDKKLSKKPSKSKK